MLVRNLMDQIAKELARRLAELDAPNVSRSLDLLIEAVPSTLNYGRWCEARFLELVDHLKSIGETRRFVWVIPISITPALHVGRVDIGDVREAFSPSRLYLLSNPLIFAEADEEYRAALPLSQKRSDGLYSVPIATARTLRRGGSSATISISGVVKPATKATR